MSGLLLAHLDAQLFLSYITYLRVSANDVCKTPHNLFSVPASLILGSNRYLGSRAFLHRYGQRAAKFLHRVNKFQYFFCIEAERLGISLNRPDKPVGSKRKIAVR